MNNVHNVQKQAIWSMHTFYVLWM